MIKRALLAVVFLGCTRAGAAQAPGATGPEGNRDEVVRFCIENAMPAALAQAGAQLGPGCDTSAGGVAGRLFEAGAHAGVVKGTARVHGAGLRAAAEQMNVAPDIAAQIANRTREQDEKAARSAADDASKAVDRIAGGTCVAPPVARALVDEGARCAAEAYETDQYEDEYARGYGAVCEHSLSATECAERARAAYPHMPRGDAADGGR